MVSIWHEFGPQLGRILAREMQAYDFQDWRPGDQRIYISDVSEAERDFGWVATVSLEQGLPLLVQWVQENEMILGDLENQSMNRVAAFPSVPVGM